MRYKQQKYNLLREETEGYSKLVAFLTSSLVIPHYTETEAERIARVDASARTALRSIQSLIGYFDLDPNRVLDILLDILTANVLDHWDVLLRILEISPWCGGTNNRNGNDDLDDLDDMGATPAPSSFLADTTARETRIPLPSFGQILGNKFHQYATQDKTPHALFVATALCLSYNLASLSDIWPHMAPAQGHAEWAKQEEIAWKKCVGERFKVASAGRALAVCFTLASFSYGYNNLYGKLMYGAKYQIRRMLESSATLTTANRQLPLLPTRTRTRTKKLRKITRSPTKWHSWYTTVVLIP